MVGIKGRTCFGAHWRCRGSAYDIVTLFIIQVLTATKTTAVRRKPTLGSDECDKFFVTQGTLIKRASTYGGIFHSSTSLFQGVRRGRDFADANLGDEVQHAVKDQNTVREETLNQSEFCCRHSEQILAGMVFARRGRSAFGRLRTRRGVIDAILLYRGFLDSMRGSHRSIGVHEQD